jgi:CSLREA domain-containing protein
MNLINKVKDRSVRIGIVGIFISCLILFASIIFALAAPNLVNASIISVNTSNDELNDNGNCSLREAIQSANLDTIVDACTAGSGADQIVFDSSVVPGTFTITIAGIEADPPATTGDLDITDDLTITGAGAAVTIIDGNQLDRVFHVYSSISVTIRNLTIKKGRVEGEWPGGGGILVNDWGTLTINNCIISDNISEVFGGAIHNMGGTLTIVGSTISANKSGRNGGGIHNSGSSAILTIEKSSIVDNNSLSGGGIWNAGSSNIINSTIAFNTASSGGGIDNGGTLIVMSSTISRNSTFGGNGGGMITYGTVELQNTILAENIAGGQVGHECDSRSGVIRSMGNNIFGEIATDGFCNISDLKDTDKRDQDSGLGCFNSDGTPGNGHLPLLSESPAIDAGKSDACPANDQLGGTRVATCDIGSTEFYGKQQYRFIVMADSRGDVSDNPVNEVIFSALLRSTRSLSDCKPKFILFSGDLIVGSSDYHAVVTQLNSWKTIVDGVMGDDYSKKRVFPSVGGHERISGITTLPDAYSAFSDVFDPVNESFLGPLNCHYMAGSSEYENTVYYCDYQNARFFFLNNDLDTHNTTQCERINGTVDSDCIDENKRDRDHRLNHEIGSLQRAWVSNNLNCGGEKCKDLYFFIHHEPFYGVNAHDSNYNQIPFTMDAKPGSRQDYWNTIKDHATLIFSGHEHHYARMILDETKGVHELKTGTCGAPIYPGGDLNSGRRLVEPQQKYHYAVVDVDDQSIVATAYALPVVKDLPDSGITPKTVELNLENIHAITFNVDQIGGSNDYTGLSEIKVIDENGTNITSDAEVIECSSELDEDECAEFPCPCKNVHDGDTTTNWRTSFRDDKNKIRPSWIRLFFHPGRNIQKIELYDTTDSDNFVKQGTLILEGENGVVKFGGIYPPNSSTFIEGIPIDIVFHDYSTHTGVAPFYMDEDQDGAFDAEEGRKDLDGDGILDYRDQDTANVILARGGGRVSIDLPEDQFPQIALRSVDTLLESASSLDQQNKPHDKYFPFDLTEMKISGIPEGGQVTVDLKYSSHVPVDSDYYIAGRWYTIPMGSNDGDQSITITLMDGADGDIDGLANGEINHRGGLGTSKLLVNNDLPEGDPLSESSGGGCFIGNMIWSF